jgi:hypothetical protein
MDNQCSHPLDVFVTNDTERKVLEIFVKHLTTVSPRKRRTATELAVSLLRRSDAPRFQNALGHALQAIENADKLN